MASASIVLVVIYLISNNHSYVLAEKSSYTTERVQSMVNDFVQRCPGVPLCNTSVPDSGTQQGTTSTECCKPCRCDTECKDSDECCPDIVEEFVPIYLRNRIDMTVENCVSSQYTRRFDTRHFKNGYMFISRCPPNFNDYNSRFKCERDYEKFDFKSEMLMNFMPVSDIKTGKTYKNKHCFDCSEDTGQVIAPWNPVVECSTVTLKLVHTPEELARFLFDKTCSLHFEFPSERFTNIPFELTPCTNLVGECNYTKSVSSYDRLLNEYCPAYKSEYNGFKNIHCFLCNNDSSLATNDNCSSAMQPAISTGVIDAPGLINAEMRRQKKSGDDICTGNITFDAQKYSCSRKRQCPRNMYNDGPLCKPLFRSVKNVKMHINLRFLPLGHIVHLNNSVQNLSMSIPHIINTFLQANTGILHVERVAFDIEIKLNASAYHYLNSLSNVTSFADYMKNASVDYIDANIFIDIEDGDMKTVIDTISQLYYTDFGLEDKFQLEYTGTSNWLLRTHNLGVVLYVLFPLQSQYAEELRSTYVWEDPTDKRIVLVILRESGPDRESPNVVRITPVVQCLQVVLEAGDFVRAGNETYGRVELTIADRSVSLTDVVFFNTYDKLVMCDDDYMNLFAPRVNAPAQVANKASTVTVASVTQQPNDNISNGINAGVPISSLLMLPILASILS